MEFHHRPLSSSLGVEALDLDLATEDVDDIGPALRDLLRRYQMVLVRDQRLSMDRQLAITAAVGPLEPVWDDTDRHPDNPAIHVVSNAMALARQYRSSSQVWHTDRSFMPKPSAATLLYAIDVPPPGAGGATSFADMRSAHRDLPSTLQEHIDGLHAVHSFSHMMEALMASKHSPERAQAEARKYPPVTHPLVRQEPITCARSLYLNQLCLREIADLPESQGQPLLDRLYAHALQERYYYHHAWRAGDVLLWDNSSLMHRGNPTVGSHPRRFHRTTTESIGD